MRPTFQLQILLAAALTLSLASASCTKPKSNRAKRAAAEKKAPTTGAEDDDPTHTAGGTKIPANTPAQVVALMQTLVESTGANTRALIALGPKAEGAMVALASSQNLAEARAAMEYFEATGSKAGGAAAAVLAEHPVPSVRHQALLALTAIGDAAHVKTVEKVVKTATDGTTRSLAIRALAAFGSKESATTLIKLLDDTDEQVTSEVAAALGTLGDTSEPVLMALRTTAASPTAAAATGALTALRILGPKALVDRGVLDKALAHADARVAFAATRLVPRLSDAAAKKALMDKLLTDVRPGVRRVALETLPATGLNDVLVRAQKLLSDADAVVAGAAAAAMGKAVSEEDRMTVLLPLVAHAVPEVRQHAVIAMAAAGDKAIKPLVARMALERDPMAQLFLARSLGRLKAEGAVDGLIKIIEDRKAGSPSKVQAMKSLQAITGQDKGINGRAWRSWYDMNKAAKPAKPAGG